MRSFHDMTLAPGACIVVRALDILPVA